MPKKRLVSKFKVELAKQHLKANPNITAKQLSKELNCSIGTAENAAIKAKAEILESSSKLLERRERLAEKRVAKAIESNEIQISTRLDTLRSNAEKLQQMADESGSQRDINAAIRAWDSLTNYERTVTGIAQAEKAETASAGKTELILQLPVSQDLIEQIKPTKSAD